MKTFIAGSKSIHYLSDDTIQELNKIIQHGDTVLIGDCRGADAAVQEYFADSGYKNVIVYVSGNNVRNNIGGWEVRYISVCYETKGYDFYIQKDIAMVESADRGLMLWDGKSKGTKRNIEHLSRNNIPVTINKYP